MNKALILVTLFLAVSSCNDDDISTSIGPVREFEILASDYDENRHFFLGHFFRDNYERWLESIPQVTSGVDFSHLEAYVLRRSTESLNTRNVIALTDLGEASRINSIDIEANENQPLGSPASNVANDLFSQLTQYDYESAEDYLKATFPSFEKSKDYLKIAQARKLDETEYTISEAFGYLSLKRKLADDEVLAVSYKYSFNGVPYQVGEMEWDYINRAEGDVIYLKLLRPDRIDTQSNTWDLMMKNIYRLNTNRISSDGFELEVIYRNDVTGQDLSSLPEGQLLSDVSLIEVTKLDQLSESNELIPDGQFDFIEQLTIDSEEGIIIFPVLEPYGSHLKSWFQEGTEDHLIDKYVYDELYNNNQAIAKLLSAKNKFVIVGQLPR
ncbi:MAG: cell surface protein SprA [Ekhidna sp.]